MQATEKQIEFLTKLSVERQAESKFAEGLIRRLADPTQLSKSDASRWINYMLDQPRKTSSAPTASPWVRAQAALADVDTSFYAIPAGYVSAQEIDLYGSDYLFVRVRNYQGKRYLSRVHGSPVSPRYSRMSPGVTIVVAEVIRDRAVEFGKLWHEHSGRCGRCNATLTDQRSRDTGFGPDCRKILGI